MARETVPSAPVQHSIAVSTPRLIFTTELSDAALLRLLRRPSVLDMLARGGYGVAIGLARFTDAQADAIRALQARGIMTVAWLVLPPEQGFSLNSQNYPQALARYREFRAWALAQQLDFDAIGLESTPPVDVVQFESLSARRVAHRFWLAGENMLFPAARAAYVELVSLIHHDGYEVHAYQLPFVADDRRAGTTLVQRALEIVDMPADIDVLLCHSSVPLDRVGGDFGGALIASYGPVADAIGISVGASDENGSVLAWPAVQRDLLLAARYTDTIYIDTLEEGVERDLLHQIAALDWQTPARAHWRRVLLVRLLRGMLFLVLISARFGPTALAWSGWLLAALLWLQGRRGRKLFVGLRDAPEAQDTE